ncbi:MAG: V-type ATP synthase subunit D [Exilibacterium sp.]
MARITLNKSALTRAGRQLQIFQRFRPSLDMKRRQLLAERAAARKQLAEFEGALEKNNLSVADNVPMLSASGLDLRQLVKVSGVDLDEENVMGVRLPVLRDISIEVQAYGLLSKPHWVDRLVEYLREILALKVRIQVQSQRLKHLDRAVQVITQRVNLFDKVLIPNTRATIKRIQLHLADVERAAVVRAKLAKAKREREQ